MAPGGAARRCNGAVEGEFAQSGELGFDPVHPRAIRGQVGDLRIIRHCPVPDPLLASFRADRDRAIAGLMLFSGLRSAEVLGLAVADVDIPRGWIKVIGKGDKERRVPLDPDVATLIQAYLLAGRPDTASRALFVVAKGPNRGQPLTTAGLRTIFRYHRGKAAVPAGHPHALRHSFVISPALAA
jgi:site-specific recombinase XerC